MKFKIQVDERVVDDVINAISYYNKQQSGLGNRFAKTIEKYFDHLAISAHHQIRYKTVRTLPTPPFPFMIHYTMDEKRKLVKIHAVIHTSLNPGKNWVR